MTKEPNHSRQIVVAAAVNDQEILASNLGRSWDIVEAKVPLHTESGHRSASLAYNSALDALKAELVVFAHQDVYLPRGSIDRLFGEVHRLERDDRNWGIIGVIGLDCECRPIGEVWDPRGRIGRAVDRPCRAVAMDELLLVVRRSSGLRFDPGLPAFHLYAADMIQIAASRGMKSYVVDCPVIHNSPIRGQLGPTWTAAYRYMQRKWRDRMPLPTLIMPVTRTGWPLLRYRIRILKRELIHGTTDSSRNIDPVEVARRIGYETDPEQTHAGIIGKASPTGGCDA